jgi:RNA polymerase sigma-70 factor (ECF subfamily)
MDTPGLHRAISPPLRLTDAELVSRCCSGDRAAWRSLYDRHSAQVYRFLSAMGVRDTEREDACQDVFLAVYRSLPSFRGDSQLSTWIYRITSRTTGKLIQKKRLRQAIIGLLDVHRTPQLTADPAEETARTLVLERMLERLNPKKRAVLVLFELEGVPVEEISRIVGCPTNTVWSRLHHARLELTKMAEKMAEKMADRSADKLGDRPVDELGDSTADRSAYRGKTNGMTASAPIFPENVLGPSDPRGKEPGARTEGESP